MKPLIIGVDPGSTSAVAAVNLEGEIELLESGKNFPPREIIQRVIKVGKPVIVASDKAKTPSNVDKIASSVGAKLFEPDQDLSSERKKDLGKGANSHELDAVASAVHAQKQLHKDIRKIRKYENELDKPLEDIAKKIFNDEPLEEGEEDEINESQAESEEESNIEENIDPEKERLESKVENLEEQVQKLRSELGEKDSRIEYLNEKIQELKEEDRREVVEKREIKKREAMIRDKNREIEDLEEEIEKFKVREVQYRKAIEKIFNGEYRPVPLIDNHVDRVPEEAVTPNKEVLEKLEKRGAEIHHIEDVEGVELSDYIVVDELPSTEDFESVIKEYREKR